MSSSGNDNGVNIDLRMLENEKSIAALSDFLDLSNTYAALTDEMEKEAFELSERETLYLDSVTAFEALYLDHFRFRRHIPSYISINENYQTVSTKIKIFEATILECRLKDIVRLEAFPQSITSEESMTIQDSQARLKVLEQERKKLVEVKSCKENAKAGWIHAKEDIYNVLNDCIQRMGVLLQLLVQQEKAFEDACRTLKRN